MAELEQSKNTIRVEFIEAGIDTPFAVSEVSIEQLPDTFEIATSLQIALDQWSVVQAIPSSKEEFSQTGELKVFLNKVQTLNPEDILFSVPTINYSIFEIETAAANANLFSIHEDDWRQLEFISGKYRSEIAQEIKSINEIYETHQKGAGFDQIHIRKLIEQPLDETEIKLTALMQEVIVAKKYDGFGVGNSTAKDGFAFQTTDKTIFYGQTDKDRIIALCVNGYENSVQLIERIVKKYQLVFVDWYRAEIIE